jgi:hypothetical protein
MMDDSITISVSHVRNIGARRRCAKVPDNMPTTQERLHRLLLPPAVHEV